LPGDAWKNGRLRHGQRLKEGRLIPFVLVAAERRDMLKHNLRGYVTDAKSVTRSGHKKGELMRARFQFLIRFVLVATAGAVAAAAVCAERSFQAAFAIEGLAVAFATAAIVAAMQTCAKARTFWIGTAVVLGPTLFLACTSFLWLCMYIDGGSDPPQGFAAEYRFYWLLWCAAPINGLFAVVLEWFFAPRRDQSKDAGRLDA